MFISIFIVVLLGHPNPNEKGTIGITSHKRVSNCAFDLQALALYDKAAHTNSMGLDLLQILESLRNPKNVEIKTKSQAPEKSPNDSSAARLS